MNIRKNILMISLAIGVIAFFFGIAMLVASAISGNDLNLIPFFAGFTLMMICPIIGFGLEVKLNKPKPDPAAERGLSPAERMEGGIVLYCPLCHANLGSQAPPKCPECGLKLR